MTKNLILTVLLFWVFPSAVFAQEQVRLRGVMEAGRAGDWRRCLELLENATSLSPEESLLISKAYQAGGRHQKTILYSSALIEKRQFEPEARWLRAQSYYQQSKYDACMTDLAALAEMNHTLAPKASRQMEVIATHTLRLAELKKLTDGVTNVKQRDRLRTIWVDRFRIAGRSEYAGTIAEEWLRRDPRNSVLNQLIKNLKTSVDGPVKIGLVVSLSGQNSEVGRAVLRGVELAVQKHNAASLRKIELAIVDDHSDIIQVIKAVTALVSDDAVSAIIGPIESDHVAAVAAIADQSRIPLISPTATRNELTSLSSFVFQANVNIETRGEAMARFAMGRLGLKTFAVLSPVDLYGDVVSQKFIQTVKQSGGRVVAFERYYDNTTDFKAQLTALRKLGFVSTMLKDWTYDAKDKYRPAQIDSVYAFYYPIDSISADRELDRPMSGIDAVFIPAYTDDIKYVGPQLAFYNIKTQLLGGQNWHDATELRLHQKYVNGVIFTSDFFITSENEQHGFVDRYKSHYGGPPEREAYYGYDLMGLVGYLIDRGETSAEELHLALKNGIDYKGLHNRITFKPGAQVNSSIQVLQFLNGQIQKLAN